MKIDFTLVDKVTAFVNNNTTKRLDRDHMYHLLVQKGLVNQDGTATKYAIRNKILD